MTFTEDKISGVGLGLRHKHIREFIEDKPDVPWLEVHTENFFNPGATASKYLQQIRCDYPLSMHCIGLSLGSVEIDEEVRNAHLQKVKDAIAMFEPQLVSDHVSWSASMSHYVPDLLPVPMTEDALSVMAGNIEYAQGFLGRQILVENPSSYASFKEAPIAEWEFLNELAKRTGCGILLDLNNIYVSAHNHGLSAQEYIEKIDAAPVQEIHLAGYDVREVEGQEVYIDTHGKPVYDAVWDLYELAVARFGGVPTLIEWDTDVPELSVLLDEKSKADTIFSKSQKKKAA